MANERHRRMEEDREEWNNIIKECMKEYYAACCFICTHRQNTHIYMTKLMLKYFQMYLKTKYYCFLFLLVFLLLFKTIFKFK